MSLIPSATSRKSELAQIRPFCPRNYGKDPLAFRGRKSCTSHHSPFQAKARPELDQGV